MGRIGSRFRLLYSAFLRDNNKGRPRRITELILFGELDSYALDTGIMQFDGWSKRSGTYKHHGVSVVAA